MIKKIVKRMKKLKQGIVLKADISKAFESTNREKALEILKEAISDKNLFK